MKVPPAIAADVICVVVFAVVGRSSHNEGNDLAGVWHTAWPFLVGLLLGVAASRYWRHPGWLVTGVVVWVCTVLAGMSLRLLTGSTAQLAFVVVATITLAILLLGWRVVYGLVRRARAVKGDQALV